MTQTQLYWVAFISVLVALYCIRVFIESMTLLHWYKRKFQSQPFFQAPPRPSKWLKVLNTLLLLPKL